MQANKLICRDVQVVWPDKASNDEVMLTPSTHRCVMHCL